VRTEILALSRFLQQFGPQAAIGAAPYRYAARLPPREYEGARFSAADGEWRVAFAFDTKRKAILLVAGINRASAKSVSTVS